MNVISIDLSGITRLQSDMRRAQKQLRYAVAVALTRTVKIAQSDVVREMGRRFDRPTPFFLRSIWTRPATKANLEAMVYLKDLPFGKNRLSAAYMLGHEFTGGARNAKAAEKWLARAGLISASERVVPAAAARLDRYGNMSRGQIQQILSQLRAGPDPYAYASASPRSRRNVRRAGRIFWSRGGHLPRGAWIDLGRVKGIKPLLLVVSGTNYRKRIDMPSIVAARVTRSFNAQFAAALTDAIRTAR